jgi:putative FmdB family regulatory protein
MPTYSYECKKCSNIQDIFHGMNAAPRIKCETCGGACRKLLGTGSGIIFKGSGFYETDYKKKGKAPSSESSTEKSKTETAATASTSTDKPATSGESKPSASGESKSATKAKTG